MSKTAPRRSAQSSVLLPRIPAASRLPHPSWRLAGVGAGETAAPLTADDFWQRLGL